MITDLLRVSEVGFALTNPPVISSAQVLKFWRTAKFDDGGNNGTPSIVFSNGEGGVLSLPIL